MKKNEKNVKNVVKNAKKVNETKKTGAKAPKKAPKTAKSVKANKVSTKKEKVKKTPSNEETIVLDNLTATPIPTVNKVSELEYSVAASLDLIDTRIGQVEDNVNTLGEESTRLALDLKTETAAREDAFNIETNARIAEDGLLSEKVVKLNKMLTGALITWGVALVLVIIFIVLIFQIVA